MLLMCSCDNELNNIVGGNTSEKAIITTSPYEFEDGTRTILTNTGSAISFAWDDNEAIGIFPIAPTTNSQAKQVITKKEGSTTTAVFDGAGWELKKGNTYAAYYPYKDMMSSATYDAVPVDYTGQVQDGNGRLAHIGANYDYMYAVSSEPTNGIVNFDLKHIGSIVMLELTMPDAGEWKDVTLTAGSDVFTTKGTMNVSDGTVSATTKSKSISLELKNVSTTSVNQTITLYMAVLPATTGEVKAVVTDASNREYIANLVSKTLTAGKAYQWTSTTKNASRVPDNVEAVDLGLSVKWANMNIGATKVSDYGNYYAWGEVKPQLSNRYYWDSYKWSSNGSNLSMTKYTCPDGLVGCIWYSGETFIGDGKITLDPEDDVAHMNWGGDWRMPTYAEMNELYSNCYWVWTSSYNGTGVAGYIVYKVLCDSDKGTMVYSGSSANSDYTLSVNHIFLPMVGYRCMSNFYFEGSSAWYWSSSLNENNSISACMLVLNDSEVRCSDGGTSNRNNGHSVRAVCP